MKVKMCDRKTMLKMSVRWGKCECERGAARMRRAQRGVMKAKPEKCQFEPEHANQAGLTRSQSSQLQNCARK